ncbi:MAG TPA: type II toxin-antitoxin system RelE/ParE family toxin [Dongiaceae bacterium]|nr:type II toxin-antitoxin system RelE/ParE family toxin [Dongiaceae bacterium]
MQTVVETKLFSRRADALLSPDERLDLIAYLALHPMAGDVIPGTGGIRKLRWQLEGKGKRGGARVIYYTYDERHPIFALLIYGKGEADDLTSEEKRTLSGIAAEIKAAARLSVRATGQKKARTTWQRKGRSGRS